MKPDTTPPSHKRRPLTPDELRLLHERTGVSQKVPTRDAAILLGVAEQTMRRWACNGDGPIRPVKVNGRLRWSVADIQAVLTGGSVAA